MMEKNDCNSNYASLLWQCASTLSSVKSILNRTNINSARYYKIAYIDHARGIIESEVDDPATHEQDTGDDLQLMEEEHDAFLVDQDAAPADCMLGEGSESQLYAEDFAYPAYPVHFY
uniref:Uncharacterized protein n=1 Tax=Acartia pacifica TaxID=335913 RepID=A0A0U2IG96_ACAPC|nr:hypothetical protein [Acartia pacifica]